MIATWLPQMDGINYHKNSLITIVLSLATQQEACCHHHFWSAFFQEPVALFELRTQNSEFYLTTLRTHRRGHRFINASRFSNGWYWNKASEYSLTKLTKKYNLQRLNKEMMPYLVGVMLSGVPLRHIAAIIGPLQQYNLNEKETDVAENFRLYVCHTLYGCV